VFPVLHAPLAGFGWSGALGILFAAVKPAAKMFHAIDVDPEVERKLFVGQSQIDQR